MTARSLFALLVAGMLLLCTGPVWAQMFGKRTMGENKYGSKDSSVKSGTDASGAGTTLQGNERFIRGNRSKKDFVGAKTPESGGFVGMEQASEQKPLQSAVADLKIETAPDANKAGPPQPPKKVMYEPRLAVGFGLAKPASSDSTLQAHLASSPSIRWAGPCEVTLEGRTAILRGTVASERDRMLAGLFALFEPGISKVRNELQVAAPNPAALPVPMPSPSPSDQPPRPEPGQP